MKTIFHSLFLICILLSYVDSAFSSNGQSPSSDSQLVIGSIQTAGSQNIEKARILAKVRSKVGQLFDADVATEDAKRIAELEGVEYSYYNTNIEDNKVQLTFVVVERNVIRSIAFIGNRSYKYKALRKKLGFDIGDYLDPVLVESYRTTLVEFYRLKGFVFIQVSVDEDKLSSGEVAYRIDEGPRVKIASLRFRGNSAIKTRRLKKAIKTKKRGLLLRSKYYIEEKVAEDVARLQSVYHERGFLDSKISMERQFNEKKNKVRLIFVIEEGAAYSIESIVFDGNTHFSKEQLQQESELEPGRVYNDRKVKSEVKRLVKLYLQDGFIDAKVEHRLNFVSTEKVSLEFVITEGQQFRIGKIDITGNEQTQDKVVRRILDEFEFQPGEWFNAHIARGDGTGELERYLQRAVLTERDGALITPSGQTPGQRDAQVDIVEGRTGMIMLGAAATTDSGIIGQLSFEQRNFDYKDHPESIKEFITGRSYKGAGQKFKISLQPGTKVTQYSVSFTEPYFRDKPVSLNLVGSSWNRYRESYDETRTKGFIGFEKRYKNRWRRSIGFRAERIDVGDIDYDAPVEIRNVGGGNSIFGVRFGVSRDLTNNRFNPSDGHNFDAGYEQVGGEHSFGILSGTYRKYQTLYEDLAERKTILAAKLLGATTVGNAPPFEKFYAGGSGTYGIRGFEYRGVSTRGLRTNVPADFAIEKDPIGSDWIFLANAEITVPLIGNNFAALFFVDSGTIDTGGYRAAAGAGIQIMVPQMFGPVPMRLEYSKPLRQDDLDETQAFSFSMGGLF